MFLGQISTLFVIPRASSTSKRKSRFLVDNVVYLNKGRVVYLNKGRDAKEEISCKHRYVFSSLTENTVLFFTCKLASKVI